MTKSGKPQKAHKPNRRRWNTAGASVRGASHIRNNQPCQDAIAIKNMGSYHVLSLSDGHGSSSCPYSAEGAQAAVDAASSVFDSILRSGSGNPAKTLSANKDIWLPKQIEQQWKNAVRELHKSREDSETFSYELYGATLLSLVVTEDFAFALQIGDGDILAILPNCEDESKEDESHKPRVEWVITQEQSLGQDTNSLCQNDAWQYAKSQFIPLEASNAKVTPMFLMCTDGYANSFVNEAGFKKAGADFYALYLEEGLDYIDAQLEAWLAESSAVGSGDDISLAIAVSSVS